MYAVTIPPGGRTGTQWCPVGRTVVVPGTPRQRDYMEFVTSPHFATWLAGTVLPALTDRARLDLTPMEHYER